MILNHLLASAWYLTEVILYKKKIIKTISLWFRSSKLCYLQNSILMSNKTVVIKYFVTVVTKKLFGKLHYS